MPSAKPSTDATDADHERFQQHGAADLLARRTDRAQRRELARALGDGDRHRVEDDESADEEREPPNASRKYLMKLMNSDTSDASSSACSAPVRTWALGGQDRLDVGDELLLAHTILGRDRDRVVLAVALEQLLGGRDREDGEGRGARAS